VLANFRLYRKMVGGRWYRIKYLDELKFELFIKWSRFPPHLSENYSIVIHEEDYPYRSKDKDIDKIVTEALQANIKYKYLVEKCGEDFHNGRLKIDSKRFAEELVKTQPGILTLNDIMYALYYFLDSKDIVFHTTSNDFKDSIYEEIYMRMTKKGYIECLGLNQYQFRS